MFSNNYFGYVLNSIFKRRDINVIFQCDLKYEF